MFSPENWELSTGWKRHTGVLEGTPSSEAALGYAHGGEDAEGNPAMRYFSRAEAHAVDFRTRSLLIR
jgi:hypothetical protein